MSVLSTVSNRSIMSQFFQIHPDNPQPRLIHQAIEIVQKGGIIVYPTDSGYALGCHIGDKGALDKIRRIRRLDNKHNFTLVCRDLSDIATYAKVDNTAYRLLKTFTPGAYTFIFKATRELPRRCMQAKRKTIGIRIPANTVCQSLLAFLNEPLMSTTLILPDETIPMTDPYEIREVLEHHVDLVIDGGFCGLEATTVIDMSDVVPVIVREGLGNADAFK